MGAGHARQAVKRQAGVTLCVCTGSIMLLLMLLLLTLRHGFTASCSAVAARSLQRQQPACVPQPTVHPAALAAATGFALALCNPSRPRPAPSPGRKGVWRGRGSHDDAMHCACHHEGHCCKAGQAKLLLQHLPVPEARGPAGSKAGQQGRAAGQRKDTCWLCVPARSQVDCSAYKVLGLACTHG